jgi:hypothetical protein|tara:strand:+ start:253 stop:474 length:222 start_codon:yes stop_codon:yes gene_type:complete
MNKIPYQKVKYRELKDISDLAVAVKCYNGSEAILPKSQIIEHQFEDALLVPCWLVERKDIQAANQKFWRERRS